MPKNLLFDPPAGGENYFFDNFSTLRQLTDHSKNILTTFELLQIKNLLFKKPCVILRFTMQRRGAEFGTPAPLGDIEAEFIFGEALDTLGDPKAGSVDIENAFVTIRQLQ